MDNDGQWAAEILNWFRFDVKNKPWECFVFNIQQSDSRGDQCDHQFHNLKPYWMEIYIQDLLTPGWPCLPTLWYGYLAKYHGQIFWQESQIFSPDQPASQQGRYYDYISNREIQILGKKCKIISLSPSGVTLHLWVPWHCSALCSPGTPRWFCFHQDLLQLVRREERPDQSETSPYWFHWQQTGRTTGIQSLVSRFNSGTSSGSS